MSSNFSAAPSPHSCSATASLPTNAMVPLECGDRWQVYFRLKELDIPCQCSAYQPLLASVDTVQALVQVWSVVKQASAPRLELAQWLNRCWGLPS